MIVSLTTSLEHVTLRQLCPVDAEPLFELTQRNRTHLTAHGDYTAQVEATAEDIAAELAVEPGRHWRFGILFAQAIVGRVDLIGVEPPRYGLGYWLAASHAGRGIGMAAVRTVIDFAFREFQATDIFAGVTHGNEASVALLRRLDFKPVATFATYTRFHLAMR